MSSEKQKRKTRHDKHTEHEYKCDCARYCKGMLRVVSRRTYYSHAPYRTQQVSQSSQHNQDASDPRASKRARFENENEEETHDATFKMPSLDTDDNISRMSPSSTSPRAPSPMLPFSPHAHSSLILPPSPRPLSPLLPPSQVSARADLGSLQEQGQEQQMYDDDLDIGGGLSEQDDHDCHSPSDEEVEPDDPPPPQTSFSQIEEIALVERYIVALQNASLDDPELGDLGDLLTPPEQSFDLDENDEDEQALLCCLRMFLAHVNSSEESYSQTVAALRARYPDDTYFSYDQMKRRIAKMSGIKPIISQMCPNSCMAYTGPLAKRDTCLRCSESRWADEEKEKPRQTFSTIPLAYIIQALKRGKRTAKEMDYFMNRLKEVLKEIMDIGEIQEYDDIACGEDILRKYVNGELRDTDTVLMLSFDGCQIYRMKQSDCWIFIWIILSISPDRRYKKGYVIPGGVIPGPGKPKIIESFLYIALLHIAAVNHFDGTTLSPPLEGHGVPVWDAVRDCKYISGLYVVLATADGPGMTYLNGLVGHSGKIGCRLWCGLKGRRRPGDSHYYPALRKPTGFSVPGCDHETESARTLRPIDPERYRRSLAWVKGSRGQTQHESRRLATGICKPSLLEGLGPERILGLPNMFPGDIMHEILNLGSIFMSLWRGTLKPSRSDSVSSWRWAVFRDENVWARHGQDVARCTPYLPGSFDRPPRNPAEKINSGYKAWEWLLYLFSLGPSLFLGVLPYDIWRSFCKCAAGIRLLYQKRITRDDITKLHRYLIEFTEEFEELYVCDRTDRIHFVRQTIHNLAHSAPEILRIGPGACSSQWTMENAIGNLTREIRQHSTTYANLSNIAVQRAELNALKFMIPQLDTSEDNRIPKGAIDIGNGYVLLRAKDSSSTTLTGQEASALRKFLRHFHASLPLTWIAKVVKWSRLRLPNGQVARSQWKESLKSLEQLRMARNVKLPALSKRLEFAEVWYYFQYQVREGEDPRTLAMISVYGRPSPGLLEESYDTVWSCKYLGSEGLQVVAIEEISSVVAIIPHSTIFLPKSWEGYCFVAEKPGLEVADMGGARELVSEEE